MEDRRLFPRSAGPDGLGAHFLPAQQSARSGGGWKRPGGVCPLRDSAVRGSRGLLRSVEGQPTPHIVCVAEQSRGLLSSDPSLEMAMGEGGDGSHLPTHRDSFLFLKTGRHIPSRESAQREPHVISLR